MTKSTETKSTDLATLESAVLADISAAADPASLDAVRVAALGKKGRISELLATLGLWPNRQRVEIACE
jgi:phenylalanyl-tRNA synthetase alpha chain